MNGPTCSPNEDIDQAVVASTLSLDLFDVTMTLQLPVHEALSTQGQSKTQCVMTYQHNCHTTCNNLKHACKSSFQCKVLVKCACRCCGLRTVPTIGIAHTFCASPDTRICYRQCLS